VKTVISVTGHDFYAFPLPFVAYSWNKIGIDCIVFMPEEHCDKLTLAKRYCSECNSFYKFRAPIHKEPTYAQVSRLFGCCLDLPENEMLITGDADLCVFGDTFSKLDDGSVHIIGSDLVSGDQYPMCFLMGPVKSWRNIMQTNAGLDYQFYLDQLLDPIECEHFRSNQWCFDQNLAFKNFNASELSLTKHNRAALGTQFATRRADRDGWPEVIPPDIIDAHLPRPGYTEENFAKILNLFQAMYPLDNFDWMIEYRNQYVELITQ